MGNIEPPMGFIHVGLKLLYDYLFVIGSCGEISME